MKSLMLVYGVVFALATLPTQTSYAHETMTDRCSAEVAFPPNYDGQPNAKGVIILKRESNGSTGWRDNINVATDGSGHIRWWCHSTTGNDFDMGTWRFDPSSLPACIQTLVDSIQKQGKDGKSDINAATTCAKLIEPGASAWQGWTPEQSRCGDHSTKLKARLGPDRLLQIQCLGK